MKRDGAEPVDGIRSRRTRSLHFAAAAGACALRLSLPRHPDLGYETLSMSSKAHTASPAKNALGGLVGALAALLGILIGSTVANLTGGEHPPSHQEASEGH